ncbi:glycosyltransferase family 2 protein [Actinosynnema pretiosum]|uniref:glycosyltransferase family 2 protein n=1 Tax=Actinosynnema pretiosum TaxID=42197 RepID=UPI000AB6728E|nr:glycosyltransferase family 2 protein [Actinosynnema pretiosum]
MTPRITFVLVTYGGGELAAHCLDVLAEHTPEPYEVVVVDSASPDGSGEWLERNLTGATVVRMTENLGFGAGCNLGVQHARTEFVCFLNADVEVTEGWLAPLLELLDRTPAAAAAAPLMVFPDGRLQEAGSLLGGDAFSRGWGDGWEDGAELYPRVVDYASAACLVVRRRAFHDVGGFSSEYHIAYYEDTDLQFGLRDRGWQVWVQPSSHVVHVRHGTSSTATAERLSDLNREVFRRRWADDLALRPPALGVHEHPHRLWWLRDKPASVRVLVVAAGAPADGDRDAALLSAWRADPEAAVALLVPEDAADDGAFARWRSRGVEVRSGDAGEVSRERVGNYDVVVALGDVPVEAVTRWQRAAVKALDLASLPHRAHERRFALSRAKEDAVRAGAARARTAELLQWADVVSCASEEDAEWVRGVAGATAHVLTHPVEAPPVLCELADRVAGDAAGDADLAVRRVLVAPFPGSAGLRSELVRAMAVGTPFVTTWEGADGLGLPGWVFECTEEQLLTDDELWGRVHRELVAAHRARFTPERFRAVFADLQADCGVAPAPLVP